MFLPKIFLPQKVGRVYAGKERTIYTTQSATIVECHAANYIRSAATLSLAHDAAARRFRATASTTMTSDNPPTSED